MKKIVSVLFCALLGMSAAVAGQSDEQGLVSKKSPYSVTVTLDRLEKILKDKGVTIATRWSHDAGAAKAGISLRPTELLIFGNPNVGSHFFTSKQAAGIDLPMKALAWQGEAGQVWLTYNDPAYIAGRHGIKDRGEVVQKMSKALDMFSNAAVAP